MMNEPSLNDPLLQALEARLAALPPQESSARQQELLYRCAFAAGKSSARRAKQRWQAIAAALALMIVAVSIPLVRAPFQVARHELEPIVPQQPVQPERPLLVQQGPPTERQPVQLDLDAWQVESSASASLDAELDHFQQSDPGLRALAVGTLTRAALGP
jgi:hypothetical protein